jgi:hypothetical protein
MSLLIVLGLAGALVQSVAPPTATVSGRVLEEGSQTPIPRAEVWLTPSQPRPDPVLSTIQPRTVVTDAAGRYAFEDVEAGRYSLTVHKPGFALPNRALVQDVTLTPGERRQDVNVLLQKGAVIAGRVLDDTGEPVVDVRVMAMRGVVIAPGARVIGPEAPFVPGGQGQTNDLGEFRLFGLPAGEYVVQVMPRPDFGGSAGGRTTTTLATYFPGTSDRAAAEPIRVGAGQVVSEVTIRMVGVPAFQVSGVVLDDARRPVANAMVRVMSDERTADPALAMALLNQSRTDTSGRFSINNVPSGTYVLVTAAPLVLSGPPIASGGIAKAGGGSSTSFGISGGFVGGTIGGGVITETTGATTIEYRDDTATRMSITVNQASVTGLEVIVRSPAR